MTDDDKPDDKVTAFPDAAERLFGKLRKDTAPLLEQMAQGAQAMQDAIIDMIGFPFAPNRMVIDALMVTTNSLDPRRPTILRARDTAIIARLYEFARDVVAETTSDGANWAPCFAALDAIVAEHESLFDHFTNDDDLRFLATLDDQHDIYAVPALARPVMEAALTLSLSRESLLLRDKPWVRGQAYMLLLSAIRNVGGEGE